MRSDSRHPPGFWRRCDALAHFVAMASSQTRIAETISLFYTADRASDVSWVVALPRIPNEA
jgi:hypothetical protein